MNKFCSDIGEREVRCKSHERFRLEFQRRLTDYLLRHGSAAKGFGLVWEQTLEEVTLDDEGQAQLYRELLAWVQSDKLFTGPDKNGP